MAMIVKDRLDAPWDSASTVDPEEIARFNALAQEWWNPRGRFRPIHDFNSEYDWMLASMLPVRRNLGHEFRQGWSCRRERPGLYPVLPKL